VSQDIGQHLRLGATVSNVFNSRAITAIATSASGAPTTTVNGAAYQTGYGQGDQFSFLPPRAFLVDMRVKF
jgi:iron complex outermembrane receptor protein